MTDAAGLHRLLAWISPGFPTGAYAYSHGLEFAVEAGRVTDADSLRAYIETALAAGAGRADGVFFCQAWRAVAAGDEETLAAIAERARAMRGTAELAAESTDQGRAFLDAVAGWEIAGFARWRDVLAGETPHCVASAAAFAAQGIAIDDALAAFLHAFAANLTSAGVRLIPLGQSDGQRVLAALGPAIEAAASRARKTEGDDWGTAAPLIDWMSARHETQYTRLFRS